MLKKQNGITLIALIITVIVMLILVGVTINVALNGGLFEKAEYASEQMQIKAEEEELLSAIVAAIGTDGKIDFNYLDNNLPTRWSKVEEKTYKSPKDNIYEVDANGKITYKGKNTGGGNTPVAFTWASVNLGNVDTSAEYKGYIEPLDMTVIVSFTEDGRVLMHEGGETIEIDAKDEENIDEESGNLSFSLELIKGTTSNITVKMNGNNIDAEIQGLGTIPYVKQGKTIYSNEEVLKMLGITNFTGTYNGTWTVLESGADGNPIKLVSTSAVSNYTLGHDDPRAIEAISIVGTEPTSEEKLERSIWSYKNVVNSLNAVVKEKTGISLARSINIEDIETLAGIQDSDKGDNYNQPYTYNYTTSKNQVFVDESGNTVKIDSEGKEVTLNHTYYYYDLTEDQKAQIGRLTSGNYWLASPCVSCSSNDAYFIVRCMLSGSINSYYLFNSYGGAGGYSYGVRAVVSISSL